MIQRKVNIANLIGDRRLLNNVWFYHDLTKDKANHEYIYISNNKNYKFNRINTALDRIKIMSADEFLCLCQTGCYDAVFLHAIDSFPFNKTKNIPKEIKVFWLVWGYDLYGHPWNAPMIKMNLYKPKTIESCPWLKQSFIYDFLRRFKRVCVSYLNRINGVNDIFHYSSKDFIEAVSRIDYFSGVLTNEYDLVKDVPYFRAEPVSYAYASVESMYESVPSTIPAIGDNVLVGNSAAETNNHLDILEYIKDFKPDKRKVILTLSYSGIKRYVDMVIAAYQKVFGDKIYPLLQLMSLKEYNNVLCTCGYGIFFHERQKGIGNISVLIMNGAKVFLSDTSVAYHYYKSMGIYVYSVQKDLNPESLSTPLTDEQKMYNIKTLGATRTFEYRIRQLCDIYEIIKKDHKI